MLADAALQDSMEGVRCSQALLSLWNGEVYRCDLQDLLNLSSERFEALQRLVAHLRVSRVHLEAYLSRDVIFRIMQNCRIEHAV